MSTENKKNMEELLQSDIDLARNSTEVIRLVI